MQDETPAKRRRRRRPEIQEVQPEPVRIVVGRDDEQPEWMVSAGDVNGAASRRTGTPAKESAPVEKVPAKPAESDPVPPGQAAAQPVLPETEIPQPESGDIGRVSGVTVPIADDEPVPPEDAVVLRKKPAAARKGKKKKGKKKQTNAGWIGKAALLVVLVAVVIVGGVFGVRKLIELKDIRDTLDRGRDVFYENIYMNDIPLQGMTLEQAAQYVTAQVDSRLSGFKITLRTVDGRTWDITKDDLQMKYDVADQLDRLWSIGHIGNAATCYEQIKALQENEVRQYSTMTYDLSKVNQILTQIKAEVDLPAVNATRVDDDTKWPPYSYTDDTPGQTLDITGLNERIMGMVDRMESGLVELTPVRVEAKVTRAALEGSIVKLATYETAIGATSHEGRFRNIEIGTGKFNHLIVHSGEQVSFNKVAGKRTEANGFVEAPEIAYGEYVMGIGGGICQVSSTLYNAVVNAGLEVIKRTQHSLASNYVPMGLDATVSDDRLDFIFRNSTNADIFFETAYYKKKNYWYTSFTIYGRPDPNGYTYKLESEIREEIPLPEPIYRPDRKATYVVYENQTQLISKGEIGHIVDVYLVTTDSSGMQISRELKYTDTYKPIAPVYWIGVTPLTAY
ncbi:MAG: VanW family protein [Clostridia bacterium]|nr:VanW family protein [Clostridia bacterium]